MTAQPLRQADHQADPAHADRVLRSVFGDYDFLGRLDAMIRGRPQITGADVEGIVEQAVVEAVRQVRIGKPVDDPQALVWWLSRRKAGELSSARGEVVPLTEELSVRAPDEVTP